MSYVVCVVALLVVGYYIFSHIKYTKNAKLILEGGKDLMLKDIIIFSNQELARRIKKNFDKNRKSVKIYYFNEQYITIDSSDTKEHIMYKIENIQKFLREQRYETGNVQNSAIEDSIDEEMLDIWLDYGYKERYRIIFGREMDELLKSEQISNSTFNRMYCRFYQFDRSEFELKK